MERCKNPDKCKATVQMGVINIMCQGSGMDMDVAIRELGLDELKYMRLAYKEDYPLIARTIRRAIKEKVK